MKLRNIKKAQKLIKEYKAKKMVLKSLKLVYSNSQIVDKYKIGAHVDKLEFELEEIELQIREL
jgi:hypothetical protein